MSAPIWQDVLANLWFTRPGGGRAPAAETPVEAARGVYLAPLHAGAAYVARELSKALPGQFWAAGRHLCWNRGGQMVYLLEPSLWPQIEAARSLATRLGVETESASLGGVARKLLSFVGPPARGYRTSEARIQTPGWGYRRCEPGRYAKGTLYDIEAAYFQALRRLPSYRVTWLETGPIWHPMTAEETARREAVESAISGHKGLRNVLIGAMMGSRNRAHVYAKGERLPIRLRFGPFRAAGLACARACYELTWEQATEGASPYSNTDCVFLHGTARPAIWERWGYLYRARAHGDADIRGLGCYQVGSLSTYWYASGSRLSRPTPGSPAPGTLTYRAWH